MAEDNPTEQEQGSDGNEASFIGSLFKLSTAVVGAGIMSSSNSSLPMAEDNPTTYEPLIDEQLPLLANTRDDHGEQEQGSDGNGASFTGSLFNLSAAMVGAGIMAMPAAMKVLGLALGLAAIMFLALLTETSLEILVRFSREGNAGSYGEVMGYAFGRVGRWVFHIFVLINNFETLVVYMIMLGWFGEHWWTGRAFVVLVTALFVLAPLAFFMRIDSLRYTSASAVALAVVFLVITAGITFIKLFNGSIARPRMLPNITNMASIWNLFTVVPFLVTAFVCHSNVHALEAELGDSSLIQPVMRASLVLCTSIFILTALFGFLLFGDSTLDDVLANFDTDLGIPYSSLLSDIVCISYAIHLMLIFPVIFFSLRFNFNDLIFSSARSLDLDKFRFALITVGLTFLVYVAAIFLPSIWYAFQFTGATVTVCLGFVFPAAISLRDPHGIATKRDKISSIVMIVLSVFSNAVAIYSDAAALLRKIF